MKMKPYIRIVKTTGVILIPVVILCCSHVDKIPSGRDIENNKEWQAYQQDHVDLYLSLEKFRRKYLKTVNYFKERGWD